MPEISGAFPSRGTVFDTLHGNNQESSEIASLLMRMEGWYGKCADQVNFVRRGWIGTNPVPRAEAVQVFAVGIHFAGVCEGSIVTDCIARHDGLSLRCGPSAIIQLALVCAVQS